MTHKKLLAKSLQKLFIKLFDANYIGLFIMSLAKQGIEIQPPIGFERTAASFGCSN